MNNHPSDSELQQFAESRPEELEESIALHINDCPACKQKAELYRVMFAALGLHEPPGLDAGVMAAVMKRIPIKKRSSPLIFVYTLACLSVPLAATLLFFLLPTSYISWARSVSSSGFALLVLGSMSVMAFLLVLQLRHHRNTMQLINDSTFLQPH